VTAATGLKAGDWAYAGGQRALYLGPGPNGQARGSLATEGRAGRLSEARKEDGRVVGGQCDDGPEAYTERRTAPIQGLSAKPGPVVGDPRLPPHFWEKVRLGAVSAHRPDLGPCWEWMAARFSRNYGSFMAGSRTDGSARQVRAHRLAYETLVGPIPDGFESDHLCRNHSCIRPSHIEPVTHQINMERSPLVGRTNGEAHGQAKLTEGQVREIRRLRSRVPQRSLAARFGVSHSVISRIQRGESWAHIGEEATAFQAGAQTAGVNVEAAPVSLSSHLARRGGPRGEPQPPAAGRGFTFASPARASISQTKTGPDATNVRA